MAKSLFSIQGYLFRFEKWKLDMNTRPHYEKYVPPFYF